MTFGAIKPSYTGHVSATIHFDSRDVIVNPLEYSSGYAIRLPPHVSRLVRMQHMHQFAKNDNVYKYDAMAQWLPYGYVTIQRTHLEFASGVAW